MIPERFNPMPMQIPPLLVNTHLPEAVVNLFKRLPYPWIGCGLQRRLIRTFNNEGCWCILWVGHPALGRGEFPGVTAVSAMKAVKHDFSIYDAVIIEGFSFIPKHAAMVLWDKMRAADVPIIGYQQ